MKKHVIVSGTGRAGTTFLIEILSEIGIDTGRDRLGYYDDTRAGLEYDITREDAPYVVKDPRLSINLEQILEQEDIAIDHALLPVRELHHAAKSRIKAETSFKMSWFKRIRRRLKKKPAVAGGLWGVRRPSQQETELAKILSTFVVTLAKHDIPVTMIFFPRMVEDEDYLFRKLQVPFPTIDRTEFGHAFRRIADLKKVTVQ